MKSITLLLTPCLLALAAISEQLRLTFGASEAYPAEFPHHASLKTDGDYLCGGALITRTHVLTAAHCVDDYVKKLSRNLTVEVGSTEIGQGQTHNVKRISIHKDYLEDDINYYAPNDIAIVTLSSPVTESDYVKSISLPEYMSEVATGSTVTISGFGTYDVDGSLSDYLLRLNQTVVRQEDCSEYFLNNPSIRRSIASTHLCAEGDGLCYADSGSPLIQDNKIIGIASGGNGDCGSGYPDIYTKVSHFISYIHYEINFDQRTIDFYCDDPSLAVNL